MATGRSLQLTKQVGEYLVAAELCRRKLIATTFTGNVPDYDIVAISGGGESILFQINVPFPHAHLIEIIVPVNAPGQKRYHPPTVVGYYF